MHIQPRRHNRANLAAALALASEERRSQGDVFQIAAVQGFAENALRVHRPHIAERFSTRRLLFCVEAAAVFRRQHEIGRRILPNVGERGCHRPHSSFFLRVRKAAHIGINRERG